jgi:hypothetical protein
MKESELRNKMLTDIFIILDKKLRRDNKNNYCKDHAMERAKVIENSLYNNCKTNSDIKWSELYNEINPDMLVDSIEAKTPKCIY